MLDILTMKDFLDPVALCEIRAHLRAAANTPATVYASNAAGAVDPRVRKAARLLVPPEISERIKRLLLDRKNVIEAHFKLALSEIEEPQFLRYTTGDYFVAHQDGNTPLIRDASRFRKISVVIFLDTQSSEPAPDTYGGGSLVFQGPYPHFDVRLAADATPGALVAFRAETTHEVTPVTYGERHTIVCWFH
ncbi:MAG TPA: 2OG-Fe(II) oxygenase [Planctomycetota bacterium]|nr:2OG-Fe(II) oxygenase [Planctomycetota bacterium]